MYKNLFKLKRILTGIELPCEIEVGNNLVIDYFGDNYRVRNGVAVGLARIDAPRVLVIGNNVDIGAGAKILGNIKIGGNVVIGANAVVIRDAPDNMIAVGVPAALKSRSSNSKRVVQA